MRMNLLFSNFSRSPRFLVVLPQKFKEILDRVYDYIGHYQCKALLADLSNMQAIPQDVQAWIEADWFPRMLQRGVKFYAMVKPTSALANMTMDNIHIDEDKNGIKNGYFQDHGQARAWLDSLAL
jgi:hypothetical protein